MSDTTTRRWDYTSTSGLFIVAYHLALLIGLPFYFYYNTPSVAPRRSGRDP